MDWNDPMLFDDEIEHSFMCPYCWQAITMLLDPSAGAQCYIEDCEICCNPIEIDYAIDREGFLTRFEGRKLQ